MACMISKSIPLAITMAYFVPNFLFSCKSCDSIPILKVSFHKKSLENKLRPNIVASDNVVDTGYNC